jgi:hypothetical protein
MFNNFFINVVKDIGDENVNIDKSHPSIIKIEDNKTDDTELSFRPVTEEYVNKQISKLTKIKKILQRYVIYISDQITVPYLNIETGNRRLNIVDDMFSLQERG